MADDNLITKPTNDEKVVVEKKSSSGKTKVNNKRLFIVLGAFLLIFVALFGSIMLLLMSPKRTVKSYWKATSEFNADKVVATMYDKFLTGYEKREGSSYKDLLKDQFEKYGVDDYKIVKYDINFNYTEFTEAEAKGYKKMLNTYYGIKENKIKKLRYYSTRYVARYGNNPEEYITEKIILAKIGLKWYAFPNSPQETNTIDQ